MLYYYHRDEYRDAMADAANDYKWHQQMDRLREEHPDLDDDDLEDMLREEEAGLCGCSDPGCPCEGPKRGGPP